MAAKSKAKAKTKSKVKAKTKSKPAPKAKAKVKAKAPTKAVAKKDPAKKAAPVKPAPVKAKAPTAKLSAKLNPLDDRIVVEVAAAETQTAGGLYIPDSAADKPSRGTVLATGKGRRTKKGKLLPLDVQVGDEVLYAEYSGTKLTVDGREVLILRESDVLGVLE